MMLPILAPIITALASNGLNLLASAVTAKGQEFVEEKLGVKIDAMLQTDEGKVKLAQIQADREQDLNDWVLAMRTQELEFQKAQEAGVSDRWKADMGSDSWLSKNIRPMVLIYLVVVFTLFAVGSAATINVGEKYIALLGALLEAVFYAYFGGRSLEKITGMITSKMGGAK